MYGTNKTKLVTIRCVVCKRWVAVRLDPDDLAAFVHGKALIQNACPYLDAGERELFLSSLCPDCWALLCPDPVAFPLAYN